MTEADDWNRVERKLHSLAESFTGRVMQKSLTELGVAAKKDIDGVLRGTLGDQSMSHWTRSKPIALTTRFDLVGDSGLVIHPGRRETGPWRVLEEGRKAHTKGDITVSPGRPKKDGTLGKPRKRKSKRTGGATAGKGTWSAAAAVVEEKSPARMARIVNEKIRSQFGI